MKGLEAEISALEKLKGSLPSSSEMAVGDDLDLRARAVLTLLMNRLEQGNLAALKPIGQDPRLCPNCGEEVASKSSPYCGDCCRGHAAFVRQMRDSIANDSILDEHRQTMKGEVLWRLLGGGLPRRLSLVPEKARERVFKREEGKCEVCGAPSVTIDNTGSG